MNLKNSAKLGPAKKDLKRFEIYLSGEVIETLAKEAEKDGRSTKNYIETLLNKKAVSLKGKK